MSDPIITIKLSDTDDTIKRKVALHSACKAVIISAELPREWEFHEALFRNIMNAYTCISVAQNKGDVIEQQQRYMLDILRKQTEKKASHIMIRCHTGEGNMYGAVSVAKKFRPS